MEVILGLLVLMGMVTFRVFARYYEELQAEDQASKIDDPVEVPSQAAKQEESSEEALLAQDRLKKARAIPSAQRPSDQTPRKTPKQPAKHHQEAARQGMKWSQILGKPKGW